MTREEAIDIVRKNYPHVGVSGSQFETALRNLIPELIESEDERIRKGLIEVVSDIAGGWPFEEHKITKNEALSYLKKQKEFFEHGYGLYYYHNGGFTYINSPAIEGEKQKEQKPTSFNEPYNPDDYEVVMEGNATSLKKKEKKPADDKAFEEWIDGWWKHNKVNNPDSYDKGDEIQFDEKGFKNFCRGIRNMYANQESAEWSEEDEKIRNLAIEWAETMSGQFSFVDMDSTDFCKIATWLKSLRPQSHWKPSEEQMEHLKRCFSHGKPHLPMPNQHILESLYNDLKKLM